MPPKALPTAKTPSIPPSQSLFVANLPDLNKEDLRRELYILFSTYGSVLDINSRRTPKMRGQAHIAFKDVQTAVQALRNLDGFEFFGKHIRIQYSKSKSEFISKLDGTFKTPQAGDGAAGSAGGASSGLAGTALQQSVFRGGPPAASTAHQTTTTAGLKRTREEDDEEEMEDADKEEEEEESDDDVAMEESDSD